MQRVKDAHYQVTTKSNGKIEVYAHINGMDLNDLDKKFEFLENE